jgi:hypothetical protein
MPDVPVGFAPIVEGWNVWDVWQAEKPIEGIGDVIMNAGLSLDRQLRIWIDEKISSEAPGVNLDSGILDPVNPTVLKGDAVQIIPNPGGLETLVTRAVVPALAGALQLGKEGSGARKRTVRFFNEGSASVMPWPNDENYVLDAVYKPSATNPITSGPPPEAGAGDDAIKAIGSTAVKVGIGALLLVGAIAWIKR